MGSVGGALDLLLLVLVLVFVPLFVGTTLSTGGFGAGSFGATCVRCDTVAVVVVVVVTAAVATSPVVLPLFPLTAALLLLLARMDDSTAFCVVDRNGATTPLLLLPGLRLEKLVVAGVQSF